MEYLFFDIESATGYKGCICEFGYVITDEYLNILEKNNILINPKCKIKKRILNEILTYNPKIYLSKNTFAQEYETIKELFLSVDKVFGYSVDNDVRYVNEDCNRYKKPYINYDFYDIQKMLQEYDTSFHRISLENAINYFNILREGRLHNAMYDALNSMLLLKHMIGKLELSVEEVIFIVPNIKDITKDGIIASVESGRLIKEKKNMMKNSTTYLGEYLKEFFKEEEICYN